MIEFIVIMEPVAKGRPRFGRGFTYTPGKTRAFEEAFRWASRGYRPAKPISDPIEVTLLFQIKKPKSSKREQPCVKPDLDNFCKSVLDAMSDFWIDDSQIVRLYARKRYGMVPLIGVQINRIGEGFKRGLE